MDTKKQGFFSALREEVARGLSPGRARRRSASNAAEVAAALRRLGGGGAGEALAPLMEGPDPEACPGANCGGAGARREGWGQWVRGQLQLARAPAGADAGAGAGTGHAAAARRNDLRLLLGVMGAPLAPVHVCAAEPLPHLSIKDTPIVRTNNQARSLPSPCSRLRALALDWTQPGGCSVKFPSGEKKLCVLVLGSSRRRDLGSWYLLNAPPCGSDCCLLL